MGTVEQMKYILIYYLQRTIKKKFYFGLGDQCNYFSGALQLLLLTCQKFTRGITTTQRNPPKPYPRLPVVNLFSNIHHHSKEVS